MIAIVNQKLITQFMQSSSSGFISANLLPSFRNFKKMKVLMTIKISCNDDDNARYWVFSHEFAESLISA